MVGRSYGARFRAGEEIGRGAFATTYEAEDLESGGRVALKVLALREMGAWKELEMFEREARILRSLEHPAIPRYVDHFTLEDEGLFCIAQELAPGTSIAERVERGERTDPTMVRKILVQALDVLAYLHGRTPPVVHRDISPRNVVLADDGRVFLVDFGAAQVGVGQGTVVGTVGYSAPEQGLGRATPASDLYGLGMTILHFVTHETPATLLDDALRVDVRTRMPDDDVVARAIQKMIAPAPNDRPQSAAAAREMLAPRKWSALPLAASLAVMLTGFIALGVVYAQRPVIEDVDRAPIPEQRLPPPPEQKAVNADPMPLPVPRVNDSLVFAPANQWTTHCTASPTYPVHGPGPFSGCTSRVLDTIDARAFHVTTNAGYDFWARHEKKGGIWSGTDPATSVRFHAAARNPEKMGWQGAFPVVVVGGPGWRTRLEPQTNLMPTSPSQGWVDITAPLDGGAGWKATRDGHRGRVDWIEIHTDSWDYPQQDVWIANLRFGNVETSVAGTGCADGTREGFRDVARFPHIAGCSGSWKSPGIESAGALCGRGFHLCRDANEVARSSPTGCAGATTPTDAQLFFASAQSGPGDKHCRSQGRNDLFGCGNLGARPDPDCGVLDRFSQDLCKDLGAPWSCGNEGFHEADNVVKSAEDRGGALCCAD